IGSDTVTDAHVTKARRVRRLVGVEILGGCGQQELHSRVGGRLLSRGGVRRSGARCSGLAARGSIRTAAGEEARGTHGGKGPHGLSLVRTPRRAEGIPTEPVALAPNLGVRVMSDGVSGKSGRQSLDA